MKAIIQITSNYGFDHNWTLHVEMKSGRKSFYLGQDVKFCNRVLQMTPRQVVDAIGTADIQSVKGNKALAKFIISKLKPNKDSQPWELCAE
jgi:hypothetical protein